MPTLTAVYRSDTLQKAAGRQRNDAAPVFHRTGGAQTDEADKKQVMNEQLKYVFADQAKRAVVSLCRIDREERDIFSGTLLTAGGRLFVITCDHGVPSTLGWKIWIIRQSGSFKTKGYPEIRKAHRHADGRPDVALLELDPKELNDYLKGYEPITLSDIGSLEYSDDPERPQQPLVLVGNAAEEAETFKYGKCEVIKTSIQCLMHQAARPEEWPDAPAADPPNDPDIDLYLKSVKKGEAERGNDLTHYSRPHGLSGGGIWNLEYQKGELSSPSDFKLVGVQSSWNWKAGFLRAVRSETVVALLRKEGIL